MRKILLGLILGFIGFTACAKDHANKHEDLKKSDIIIIDTRSQPEFDNGHIEGAILIPFNEIETKLPNLVKDKKKPIALYCRSGRRSGIALKTVEAMGYINAVNYGGFSNARNLLEAKK